ncbi:hypothetical protein [Pedobacter borealis]|uniref:hypothetical protein n=1 Tax=Pedobacter borealis TaxID=475254 RepID=UPI00049391D6|nr:hypothetical protein [Pedobacter borealis]
MNKEFSDIIEDLKSRITNPFTSSFIISWLITNYQIPLSLFFYKQDDIAKDGYKSYFDLITSKQEWWNMFTVPLICAFIYTFIFPWIKYGINWYRAWVEVLDSNRIKKVELQKLVTLSKHNTLKEKFFLLIEKNAELTHKNSIQIESVTQAKEQELKVSTDLENFKLLKERIHIQSSYANGMWLHGTWEVYDNVSGDRIGQWTFDQARTLKILNVQYNISNFILDTTNRKIHILTKGFDYKSHIIPASFILSVSEDFNKLEAARLDGGGLIIRRIN